MGNEETVDMMENALRFPHTHSHDYDDEDGQRQLAPTGQLLNVRKIIDVTESRSVVSRKMRKLVCSF